MLESYRNFVNKRLEVGGKRENGEKNGKSYVADNRSRKTNTRKKTLCKGERELVDKGQGQIYERLSGVRIREQMEIFTSPFYYPSRKFA